MLSDKYSKGWTSLRQLIIYILFHQVWKLQKLKYFKLPSQENIFPTLSEDTYFRILDDQEPSKIRSCDVLCLLTLSSKADNNPILIAKPCPTAKSEPLNVFLWRSRKIFIRWHWEHLEISLALVRKELFSEFSCTVVTDGSFQLSTYCEFNIFGLFKLAETWSAEFYALSLKLKAFHTKIPYGVCIRSGSQCAQAPDLTEDKQCAIHADVPTLHDHSNKY